MFSKEFTEEMLQLQHEYKVLFGHRKGFDLEKDTPNEFLENMKKEIKEKKNELEQLNKI